MPLTDSDLSAPIDWTDPRFQPMLSDLQGHILKHHGRDHANHLFLQFGGSEQQTRTALARIGKHVLSAVDQLRQVEAHKSPLAQDGGTALFFYLSATGYAKVGLEPPADPAFRAGMRNRDGLSDPPPDMWEEHHGAEVDALLIIADVSDTKATAVRAISCRSLPRAASSFWAGTSAAR